HNSQILNVKMWSINNNTPFAAKGTIRLDHKTARKLWLVAIKATFDIQDNGVLVVADEQEEVLEDPIFNGEEGISSLKYDSDLLGPKEKVDVILNGTAYQPGSKPDKDLLVGFKIGDWGKSLKIVGNRLWDRFMGSTSKTMTQPFTQMAIQYENAYGGVDEEANYQHLQCDFRNNVGQGYASKEKALHGKRLPNIEYQDFPTKTNYKKNKVAGFCAIPNYLKPRIDYAGTYDEQWQIERAPFFPIDFSPLFFQSAPEDQQLSYLFGGEKVGLFNLTAGKPEFRFSLPELRFNLKTRIGDSSLEHETAIKTVIIEPDHPRLIIVWQSALDCHNKDHLVEMTHIECTNKNKTTLMSWQDKAIVESLLAGN
ncbi:MAG: DUF2169 domain-containing protein, partial [Proteobacteria bacterium]|nr:DUF2169 domain-containing protein [Pseudomonadota bacterium]